MLCKFTERNLSACLDGETGKISAFVIKKHLHSCLACKKKFELLRSVSGLAKQKVEIEISPAFAEDLRLRVEASGVKTPVLRPVPKLKLVLSVFSLLLVLAGGIILAGLQKGKGKEINEYGTLSFQTKAEIVCSGTGVEYATFLSQTRR